MALDPMTGQQARSAMEGALGRPLSQDELNFAQSYTGYNDASGTTAFTGDQWQKMQDAWNTWGKPQTQAATTPSTTPSTSSNLGPAATATTPAPYQPGAGNYDFYNAFRTKFNREPTQADIGAFTAANPINWQGQITQPQYDAAMAWINNYNPNAGAAGAGAGGATATTGQTTLGGGTPAPGFTANRPDLPSYTAPSPFTYDPFKAPTWDEMLSADPGIQARLRRGQSAIENSASAKGALFSPNTMQGLIDYNQEAAAQEYGNVYTARSISGTPASTRRWTP